MICIYFLNMNYLSSHDDSKYGPPDIRIHALFPGQFSDLVIGLVIQNGRLCGCHGTITVLIADPCRPNDPPATSVFG